MSHFSEGVSQDVMAMLAEMNRKLDGVTDNKTSREPSPRQDFSAMYKAPPSAAASVDKKTPRKEERSRSNEKEN